MFKLNLLIILTAIFIDCINCSNTTSLTRQPRTSITVGPCVWVISRTCPDYDIKFYLFTRSNRVDRQYIHVDETKAKSNLSESFFNPRNPTKIIIHGYNSDMYLGPLIGMKEEYLQIGDYNLFYVDWSILALGPCYFSAVHNARHVGNCIGQLVERILDEHSTNIHLIGFSLGAHVPNFVAQSLESFVIPRITGLDPAMPLFITASADNKLDASDAAFVDVIHTNAFLQGKVERCGHADFYMNGGIIQPGCENNRLACSHHRAADYFTESIRSNKGFWGWPCPSYISYLLGLCSPTDKSLTEAGENCKTDTEGMFLVSTNSNSPFAKGKEPDQLYNLFKKQQTLEDYHLHNMNRINRNHMELSQWNKLNSGFNNMENFPSYIPQDLIGTTFPYFNEEGTNDITEILQLNSDIEMKTNLWKFIKYDKNYKYFENIKNENHNKTLDIKDQHKSDEILNNHSNTGNTIIEIKSDRPTGQQNVNRNENRDKNLYKKNSKYNWVNQAVFGLPQLNEH